MKRQLLLIITLALVFPSTAFSQFKKAIGPAMGLNFNIHAEPDTRRHPYH